VKRNHSVRCSWLLAFLAVTLTTAFAFKEEGPSEIKTLSGGEITVAEMDEFTEAQMDSLGLPGMSIALINDARKVETPYEVGTWSGFRSAAICYTFDDGYGGALGIAVPEFEKYGFKLTLFIATDWSPDWAGLQNAASNGHEVASHTVSHPHLSAESNARQTVELKDSREIINSHITGQKCVTIAYPFCEEGNDLITEKYYIAARVCSGRIEPSIPGSYMSVSSITCGTQGVNTLQDLEYIFKSAAVSKGWCTLMIHGLDDETLDNGSNWSPFSSEILKNSLKFLSSRKSEFWVTTFRNAALYSKERDAVTIKETSRLNKSITLNITDDLPDSIYNFPLTVRRPLPAHWPSAAVAQNNVAVPTTIVQVDSVIYLTFDAVPDAGEVKIIKSNKIIKPIINAIPTYPIPQDSSK
jgi:hypothetical protein